MRRLSLLVVLPLLLACAASKTEETCTTGSDCPSGACGSNGQCVAVDSGKADSIATDTATNDAPPTDSTSDATRDTPSIGCTPSGDFVVSPAELPLGPGLRATYRIAKSAPVDTAGVAQPDGTRKWDFGKPISGDTDALVETLSPTGAWWSADFAGATYAVGLSSSSDLLGIFTLDASALSLRGVVSPTSAAPQTKLTYATPIPALKLPLKLDLAWTTTSNVSGTASGVAAFYTESYDVKVDAKGKAITPFGEFPVLRVRTVLTRTVGALPTVTRTYGFVAECFGTVATITSNANETAAEFTTAAEIRRLAP
jgi:hypothetical protein